MAANSSLVDDIIKTLLSKPEYREQILSCIDKIKSEKKLPEEKLPVKKTTSPVYPVVAKPEVVNTGLCIAQLKGSAFKKIYQAHDSPNPFHEVMYLFDLGLPNIDDAPLINLMRGMLDDKPSSDDANVWISGSFVIKFLLTYLELNPSFNVAKFSGDIDMFKLRADVTSVNTIKMLDNTIDFITTTNNDIVDLLMGFDLPCCRAAYRKDVSTYRFIISHQAIKSLLTRVVSLPSYIVPFINVKIDDVDPAIWLISRRLLNRIQKYEYRGFRFEYHNTDDDWPFMSSGFIYHHDGSITKVKVYRVGDKFEYRLMSN